MSPGRKGWVAVALVAGLIALTAGVFSRFLGRKRLRFPYLTSSIAAAEYQRLASEPGWSARQINVAPGIRLNGLVRPPKASAAPWVLFYQGNDSHMLSVGQAFLTRVAADQDWGLAVYAYRGYDSSDGVPHLADLAADAPEILTQLCATEKVDRSHVHLVGFSIGGHLAARAMAAAQALQPKPASLSLLAAADDIVMFRRSFYAKLDPGDDMQTRPFLDAVPAPVLVIQGTADEALGGPQQGRDIAAKLGGRAKYLELPGVGHTALLSNEAATSAVRDFIASHSK
ncbi:MAG: alpha/beta hydrolase [Polyangiaceae bacterium]